MSESRRTCIVTHTGCDMPIATANQLGIKIIPDILMFDGKAYFNGVDLDPISFYERLRTVKKLPTSSHPNTQMFLDAFKEVEADGRFDEIVCITCTSKMSGTYNTAMLAARTAAEEGVKIPIHVYDSLWVSHAQRLQVEEANRLAHEGYKARHIIDVIEEMRPRITIYIMMESLKYAYLGGRTGAIQLLAAQYFGIRPVMTFIDGISYNLAVLRNAREGFRFITKKFEQEGEPGQSGIIFHGNDIHRAETLHRMLLEVNPTAQLRIEDVGPVIGLYGGPNNVGVTYARPRKSS